ncbi:MAG: YHS domain-containing protein [Ignavibacteriae bacterium]|nr:YHS domain-containing protein [Ignavibacteriota bacterium]NOG99782.1 YHS domain-containing protein [Ignavibacteriota bacterium]
MELDPVCKMELTDIKKCDESIVDGKKYYFCSTFCRVLFENNTEYYLSKENKYGLTKQLKGVSH